MSGAIPRGACPRLAAPMETGDGLLARLVPAGPMALDAFAALCAQAGMHGNGIIEVSARGSLQVRGLTRSSAPLFAAAIEALGLDLCGDVAVIASFLPDDPSALIDAQSLARDLRRDIAAAGLALAPKVSVVVDGGGHLHLDAVDADLRLRAAPGQRVLVSLGGDGDTAAPLGSVAPGSAIALVLRLLAVIAAHGQEARARDVLARSGLDAFRAAAGPIAAPVAPAMRTHAEPIGLHRLNGDACAIGVALAFGQAQAEDLAALAHIAQANGARWIATAPGRALLLGPIGELTGFVLATAADTLGLIVDARDARRRVVACAGAPACASGLIPARALAAEIAGVLPPSQDGVAVHVSGCAKGCAHPAAAPLTVVGTEQGCGIVRGGTARSRPAACVRVQDLVDALMRARLREPVSV